MLVFRTASIAVFCSPLFAGLALGVNCSKGPSRMSFEEKDSDLQDYAFRGHGVDRGNHHGGNWNGRASHSSHLAVATTVTLQEPSVHLEDNVHSTPTRPVPVEASSTSSVQDQTPQSTSNTTGGSDKDESSEETSNGDEDSSKPGLSIHNKFRKEYQADPLSWSAELAATAASDAKQQCNGLVHTSSGQNLFGGSSASFTMEDAVNAWMDEASQYDYNNPVFGENTGHFTQVIWEGTTELGCAKYTCGGSQTAIVCNYKPAGNMGGAFTNNVAKPL